MDFLEEVITLAIFFGPGAASLVASIVLMFSYQRYKQVVAVSCIFLVLLIYGGAFFLNRIGIWDSPQWPFIFPLISYFVAMPLLLIQFILMVKKGGK